MKFNYSKINPAVVHPDDGGTLHRWDLEGSNFYILASERGVVFRGESPLYQPVDEERKIPEFFREFIVRLDSAFELAFKEQQKQLKDEQGRKALLEIK